MYGSRLRDLREKRRLTQSELAERCNIASKQIWRYENNESEPGAGHLKKLSQTLQVSSDYLLGLVNEYEERYAERDLTKFQDYLLTMSRPGDLYSAIELLDIITKRIHELTNKLPDEYLRNDQRW